MYLGYRKKEMCTEFFNGENFGKYSDRDRVIMLRRVLENKL
jgi:hypothetical protein